MITVILMAASKTLDLSAPLDLKHQATTNLINFLFVHRVRERNVKTWKILGLNLRSLMPNVNLGEV